MADGDSDTELELKQIELEQEYEKKQQAFEKKQQAFEKKQFELERKKLQVLARQKKRKEAVARGPPGGRVNRLETPVSAVTAAIENSPSDIKQEINQESLTLSTPSAAEKTVVDLTTPSPPPSLRQNAVTLKRERSESAVAERPDASNTDTFDETSTALARASTSGAPPETTTDSAQTANHPRQSAEMLMPPSRQLKRRRINRPVVDSDDEEHGDRNAVTHNGSADAKDQDDGPSGPTTILAPVPIKKRRRGMTGLPVVRPTGEHKYYCPEGYTQTEWDKLSTGWRKMISAIHLIENDEYGMAAAIPCLECKLNNESCRVFKEEAQIVKGRSSKCARCRYYRGNCQGRQ